MGAIVTSHTDVGARNYQEDRFVVQEFDEGYLLAVMDGHGGDQVVEFIANNLVGVFGETTINSSYSGRLQEIFSKLNLDTRSMHSGSTLSLVFLPNNEERAYVAVLGDSPVIIRTGEGEIFVSPEHNARSNLEERAAAEARGAVFDRGYLYTSDMRAGLQMSRALGNSELDSFLSREPEICIVELGEKSFVLVGSDGLFDPGHKDTSVQIERLIAMIENDGADAKTLVEDALARDTRDNVTAIVFQKTQRKPS